MLEGVLAAGGTAQEAQVEGYTLAGKTGTAEKAIEGGYSKTDFIASFIGFAPAKNPRLLVAVMVDTPRGDIYGGTVAAPAFERIMEFALPYLKIPPRLGGRVRLVFVERAQCLAHPLLRLAQLLCGALGRERGALGLCQPALHALHPLSRLLVGVFGLAQSEFGV